jgi:periplasmic divalent cation tolerance protein
VILLAKTAPGAYERLEQRVLEVHPHEVPCIERFDEDGVLSAFGEWRDDATAANGSGTRGSDQSAG